MDPTAAVTRHGAAVGDFHGREEPAPSFRYVRGISEEETLLLGKGGRRTRHSRRTKRRERRSKSDDEILVAARRRRERRWKRTRARVDEIVVGTVDEDEPYPDFLFHHIYRHEWFEVRYWIEKTELGREALRRRWGCTHKCSKRCACQSWLPIHLVCYLGAPLDLVQAMLTEYPESAKVTDDDGVLPLHCACCRDDVSSQFDDISSQVVKLLLRYYPEGAKKVRCDFYDGSFPLHHAVLFNAPLDAIEALIEAHPDGATTCNSWDRIPFDYSLIHGEEEHKKNLAHLLLKPVLQKVGLVAYINLPRMLRTAERFRVPVPRCVLLSFIKALAPVSKRGEQILVAASLYPELLSQEDKEGNNVLHLLASDRRLNGVNGSDDDDTYHTTGWEDEPLLTAIVRLCPPRLAGKPNRKGRYPLSLAIESGMAWDQGVEAIFDVAKYVTGIRDAATALYPFMLAASVGADSSIDTVYTLLRHAPHLVKGYPG